MTKKSTPAGVIVSGDIQLGTVASGLLEVLPCGPNEIDANLNHQDFSLLLVELNAKNAHLVADKIPLWSGRLPVVVVVSIKDENLALDALGRGAEDFLVKEQFDDQILLRTIRHALVRYQCENILKKQFFASQKLESIGRLAGGIAHDFNNLLTVIITNCQLMTAKLGKETPERQRLEAISKSAYRAASLTSQLLAFSRQQVLRPQEIDLSVVLSSLDQMLWRIIGEDIELVVKHGPNLGKIKTDPTQIVHVVTNLAVNAKDAMPEGGRLLIQTENVDLSEGYPRFGLPAGAYVMLSVADSGVGMDRSTQERIFEPFFTTKEFGRGSGLGLAAVYGIVKQSGGHIEVYSELGKGTEFKIYFPRIDGHQPAMLSPNDGVDQLAGNEKILVVEDEEGVRRVACELIREQGYQVFEASNAVNALEMTQAEGGRFDLVLTDLVMPKMNGPQLIKHLKEQYPHIKAVFMSGYTDNFAQQQGMCEEGAIFVQKPFMPEILLAAIRRALDASNA